MILSASRRDEERFPVEDEVGGQAAGKTVTQAMWYAVDNVREISR